MYNVHWMLLWEIPMRALKQIMRTPQVSARYRHRSFHQRLIDSTVELKICDELRAIYVNVLR